MKTESMELAFIRKRTPRRRKSVENALMAVSERTRARRRPESWPVTFPARYGDTFIVLIDVQPYWVHALWEVAEADLERARQQISCPGEIVIRVYDVTYVLFDGRNAHWYFDIAVGKEASNWYINLLSPNKSLIADMGLRGKDGRFVALARSNCVQTPRVQAEWNVGMQWMYVDGDPRNRRRVPWELSMPRAARHSDRDVMLDLYDPSAAEAMSSVSQEDVLGFYRQLTPSGPPARQGGNRRVSPDVSLDREVG